MDGRIKSEYVKAKRKKNAKRIYDMHIEKLIIYYSLDLIFIDNFNYTNVNIKEKHLINTRRTHFCS